jgi:hypothetical protein
MKPPIMSLVGHQTNETLPLSMQSVANKEIPNIDLLHMLAA